MKVLKKKYIKPLYIAIEGPIGVGKTTLTNLLVEYLNGQSVYEEFEENPFLESFYDDRRSVAFQTQIFFLLSRYKQQQSVKQPDLFKQSLISDYLFAKDRIFACLNLDEEELRLYEKIYDLLNMKVRKPDLVVYLSAPVDILLQRIQKRDRQYERNIELGYLSELSSIYHQFFFHQYSEAPVMAVNTNGINIIDNLEDRHTLLQRVVGAVADFEENEISDEIVFKRDFESELCFL
jgi:deoxyguanosine kinase